MDKKSKLISGLKNNQIVQKPNKYFTESEQHQIIQELISTGCTKQEIWQKYTGNDEEHGQLLIWMRKLGYDDKIKTRRAKLAANKIQMKRRKTVESQREESFENLQLKKRITELENQLKEAEMKAIAFSTMVDIAEKEFKIPIRKKYNTKPLKK